MKALPVFKGWTVDVRLKQFRKANPQEGMVFLDFDTEQGDELLAEFIEGLNTQTPEHRELLTDIWR